MVYPVDVIVFLQKSVFGLRMTCTSIIVARVEPRQTKKKCLAKVGFPHPHPSNHAHPVYTQTMATTEERVTPTTSSAVLDPRTLAKWPSTLPHTTKLGLFSLAQLYKMIIISSYCIIQNQTLHRYVSGM